MHGSARLPSRNGQRRGPDVKSDSTTSRSTLFSFPPLRPGTHPLKLPSLSPVGGSSSRDLKAAAEESARLRYTSSLKRTARPPFIGATSVSASATQPSTPATLESVEPVSHAGSRKLTASFPCSSSPPPPSPPPQESPVTDPAKPPASSSNSLDTLLANQQYAELYLVLSTLLPITSQRLLKDDAHTLRILGYRSICSCALLRFKESAEDGLTCLDIRRRLRQVGCVLASADDERLHTRVDECVVRALVMSERYEEADNVAGSLLGSSSAQPSAVHPPSSATKHSAEATATHPCDGLTAATWQRYLPHIRRFRSTVAAQQWQDALAVVDGSSGTAACLRASPLCAMLAFVHLEAGHSMTARALLLAYLATLPEPPTWASLQTAPFEHAQLWESFRSHHVFTTTLLAKASVMSGSTYLNIAAALLQRCLRVQPLYTPARVLAEFVLAYETQQASLEAAVARQDHDTVLLVSTRMLAMPEVTPVLQAEVFLARTEVQWVRRLPLEVVREASQCIAADPNCALAFRLRADALEAMHRGAEAVADRAAAAAYANPKVTEAAYAELVAQRRRHDASQAAAAAQRRSFTAFAAAAPVSPLHHDSFASGTPDEGRASAPLDSAEAAFSSSSNGGSKASTGETPFVTTNCCEPTYYTVLGVPPHATSSEIRHRYRQVTLQCHPDRLINASADRRLQAVEEFKRVGNAYSVLSDAQQRSEYDATLHSHF